MTDDSELVHSRRVVWEREPSLCATECQTARGTIRVRRGRFTEGASAGVELVEIDTGAVRVIVLPTRGMGVWQVEAGGKRFGWDSPVRGPVHPALVPVFDPSGIGWLEGFDELLVRCGLESNGAPQWNEAGQLQYPLHGRIANLPAGDLHVHVDAEAGTLSLEGAVTEARLFVKRLELRSRITVTAGEAAIEIEDTVTNGLSRPATAQMLYHVNLGPPVLGEGAEVVVASKEVQGKDDQSNAELDRWQNIGKPESGYAERVYFVTPRCVEDHWSAAMLRSGDRQLGWGVEYDTQTLPHLVVWKNPAALADGYVVGIEPAANLPNTRDEEAAAGRLINLAAGGKAVFRLRLHPLVGSAAVERFGKRMSAAV
ncbi:aldose 1-epimerase family protein [Roseimaritima sediminicola]|uniref:aldose 1-epimerase family protein n=1 Tax=Roseimaritima sediminicola TaxID=2662066 RepID=UPI00129827AD|nr:aldose 1-epimerase family protein [Roseimaritima sediminicola]